jgi:tripartite-type tricarboxylate transporter receptor subunit TctC
MFLLSRFVLVAVALLALLPMPSKAQESYPTRPVRLIVGFAAGSSGDVAGRIIGHKLADLLGQSVVVENRPGASSLIATEFVARAPKDGYTLLLATVAATINTTLMPGKGPNFEKDLAPVALVGSIPNILVVHPSVGVSDVKGLIALAKEKPDFLLYGASGIGSGPQLTAELFKQMAGIKMTGVIYPGSAQQLTDLIAGRIHLMFSPASTVLGHIQQNTIKALATTQAKRASAAPDLPTISEAALPGFDTGVWFGIMAPAGTPAPIIDKLAKVTNEALKDAELLKQLHVQGLDALGGSPEDFRRYIRSETERWARVINNMETEKKK